MIEKTILPCGLTILSESRSEQSSLALSYTIPSGSRDESPDQAGIHHFIEHLVFKGNPRYSQQAIAQLSDRMGGHLNAFTAKEVTQYYTKAIPQHLERSFDLLSHLVFEADFPESEFDKEKEVITQEIRESRDTPDSQVFDLLYERIFPDSSLGVTITGDEKSLGGLSRDKVLEFYRRLYQPQNAVLTAVGALEHQRLADLAQAFFEQRPAAPAAGFHRTPLPRFHPGVHQVDQSSLEQVYHLVGMSAPPAAHPHRAAYMLVNELFGGGASSRLHQHLREELGLVYSVSSFYENYRDCGVQMIFSITQPEKMAEFRRALEREMKSLHRQLPSTEEMERVRDHLKASTILSLESNVSRSRLITNQWLYQRRFQTIEEMSAEIDAIDRQAVAEVLEEFFSLERIAELRYGRRETGFGRRDSGFGIRD